MVLFDNFFLFIWNWYGKYFVCLVIDKELILF